MNKLRYAKDKLKSDGYSLVILADCNTITSRSRGISPLLEALEAAKETGDITAADKIVGKAAAMLYVLMGAKAVYAEVMSRSAKALLEQYGIEAAYDVLVENIINRRGDGLCPMEEAVRELDDPQQAKAAILQKLEQLKNNQS